MSKEIKSNKEKLELKVKRKRRKKKKKGFTLIELLAVIVILGLLMAIAIPSVTKYITQSRKKTVTTTVSNYIGALVNEVNDLAYTFTSYNTIYAVPIECISLERGGTSPFGEWYQANDNYWAYVLIQYDDENSKYIYGFTFKDSAGYGMYPVIESKIKESGSQIKTGLDLTKPESGSITKVTTMQVWDLSGFDVDENTQLNVLEAESDGVVGDGKKTCTLCQKGNNYAQVEEVKIEKKSLYAAVKKVGELYTGEGSSSYEKEVYFHQDSLSNNVLFANYCWKIVRTTDTGGVKIIYNGEPVNGVCDNSGSDSRIVTSKFNESGNYLSSVGYMNNSSYVPGFKSTSSSNKTIISTLYFSSNNGAGFFRNASYENGTYKLTGANGFADTSSGYQVEYWKNVWQNRNGYYTCGKSANSCSTVYYIVEGINNTNAIVYVLSNGKLVDDFNSTFTFGSSFKTNGDGTYTLINPVSISQLDYYNNYTNYVGKYICSDLYSTTCDEIRYIKKTYSKSLEYYNSSGYMYGNSFEYKDGMYKLKNTLVAFDGNVSDFDNAHYTCFDLDGECETLYYVFSIRPNVNFQKTYISLNDGASIEDAIDDMLYNSSNVNDSTIKNVIDEWYADTMTDYTDYLEDTIYCSDRRISTLGGWDPNRNNFTTHLKFYSYDYSDLTCGNKSDKFTVSSSIGNGMLTYPVGLLTAGEANLWGARASDARFLTMSPYGYGDGSAYIFQVFEDGFVDFEGVSYDTRQGVRPVVSLKPGTIITSGNGTVESPYIVG